MATATGAQPPPSHAPTPRSMPPRSSSSLPSVSGAPGASKSRAQQVQAPAQPQQSQSQSQSQSQFSAPAAEGSQQPTSSGNRRGIRTAPTGPLSDKATAFLIRRVLCPQQADKGRHTPAPIEDLLPPLTSRNDVDLQLYALIAIILREFVQNWYAKITPDETFVAEIVQIVAHITRALEQRLRKVDLESLLFDELPDLLDKHVTAYRVAHDPITQPPVRTDPREIYHSLCPLPALSPVPRPGEPESVALQAENEAAYRQLLVHGFLAILLPTEDVENGCLTALVGQIFSELIIGNTVANRLSEPWLIWELLIISSRAVGQQNSAKNTGRLRKSSNGSPNTKRRFSIYGLFWTSLQWCFLIVSFVRAAFSILLTTGSLPSRSARATGPKQGKISRDGTTPGPRLSTAGFVDADSPQPPATPVLAFRLWSAVSNLAEMDIRMPWLCGAFSILQWIAIRGPGRIADVDGVLDRLLSNSIQRHVFDATNLPRLLRTVRGSLFPNNLPAGKPTLVAPTSDAELLTLRRKCASAIWALVPKGVGRLYFSGGLFRANSVSSLSRDKMERSAELKTAAVNHLEDSDRSVRRDKGLLSLSSSSRACLTNQKARQNETAPFQTKQARGQKQQPRSGSSHSQSRSTRSAPAPWTKTGGQGPAAAIPAAATGNVNVNVTALPGADPPPLPLPETTSANASEIDTGGMAPTGPLTAHDAKGLGQGQQGQGQTSQGPGRDQDGDDDAVAENTIRDQDQDQDQDKNNNSQDEKVGESSHEEDNDNDKGDDGEGDGSEGKDEAILTEIERGILDVFSDAYCNKHLVYGALELILVRLLPELTEKGALELWSERVSE